MFGVIRRSKGATRLVSTVFGFVTKFAFSHNATKTNILSMSAFSHFIVSQTDNIVASPEDKRQYRGLLLKNGMKVLLISDPTTDKSAAAMDVNVGHLQDPRELPGLAHFCEHMLFLGTDKFPVENEYQKFLTTHGGSSNAYTACDHTNYHFDVAPDHLSGAIDRFAQFFISPLFTADATEREVNAVDSEHSNNVQNDMWRLAQLERSFSNPAHDYSKFGTGNRKTLLEDAKLKGMDPRDELLKFHKKFYSSNIMGFSVLGKESLDELESMVVPIFANVENKSVAAPEWLEHPYGPEQVGYRINVVPVKDLRSLHLFFPIPDLHPYYKSNPGHYVGHLMGHEGAGSLLSELKNRGWVNSLSAGPRTGARGFAFFSVDFDLSEEGLNHVDDIIVLMFKYIKILKDNGPQEWIHREVEDLNKMQFRFKDKTRALPYVTSLATSLHYYPLDEILFAPYMMPEYRPDLLNQLLDRLTVDNVGFAIASKIYEGKTDKKETWYGTDYSVERIAAPFLEKCQRGDVGDDISLKLPEKNDFIPTKFDLFPRDEKNQKMPPELLFDDPSTRIWYKQDDEFLMPKCCVFMHLRSPIVYSDPLHTTLSYMYVDLMKDALTEYTYNAELSGLKYSLDNGRYGFSMNVSGYNEKQSILLLKLAEKLATFKPDAKRFEILKERYVRNLKNFAMEQPYQHAMYYTSILLAQRVWTKEELLQEAETLSVEQLNAFIPRFLSALHIEAFVHGNTDREEAKKLVDGVRETLNKFGRVKPLFSSQLNKDREVQLADSSAFSFDAENKTHSNSAVEIILQTGVEDVRENMLNELLVQILQEPCFDQLRTKEQLGYIVFSGLRRSNGSQGLRFIVQSDKNPEFVDGRVEEFLKEMQKTLEEMPLDEFEKHKSALAAKRLEKPKKLSALASKYWSEIVSEEYHFNRDNVEVDYLKTLNKDDVLSFYQNLVSVNAKHRRKLSVYVYSTDAKNAAKASGDGPATNHVKKIDDVVAFKSQSPLYPLPKPYLNVPPAGVHELKSML